jgi:hypothetical protein
LSASLTGLLVPVVPIRSDVEVTCGFRNRSAREPYERLRFAQPGVWRPHEGGHERGGVRARSESPLLLADPIGTSLAIASWLVMAR